MDINPEKLRVSQLIVNAVANQIGVQPTITTHIDRKSALKNADFVQTTFQIGGFPFSNSLTEWTNPGWGYFHRFDFAEGDDHLVTCNLSGTTSTWRVAQYGAGTNMAAVTQANLSNSTHVAGSLVYRCT